jgi:hypothetical protein
MSDEEISYIGCEKVRALPIPYPGSSMANCADCGEAVWISQASKKGAERIGAIIVCMTCLQPRIKESEDVAFKMLEEQSTEIEAWLRRN